MADTPRLRALQNLSQNLPVANSRVAAGQSAARDMQLQSVVQKAPSASPTTSTAQQTGSSASQQAGQQMIEGATNQLAQQGQVAKLGNAETANANQAQVSSLQSGAREAAMDNAQRLDRVAAGAKAELYDRQMQFARDELGRTKFTNEQLADFAVSNAKSAQEYQNQAQTAQLATQRNMQMLEAAHGRIMEDLQFQYQQAKQSGDQDAMRQIRDKANSMDDMMAREKARAANKAAAWTAGGVLLGGAAGAAVGQSAAGAQGGAGVGGALGGLAGGAF